MSGRIYNKVDVQRFEFVFLDRFRIGVPTMTLLIIVLALTAALINITGVAVAVAFFIAGITAVAAAYLLIRSLDSKGVLSETTAVITAATALINRKHNTYE